MNTSQLDAVQLINQVAERLNERLAVIADIDPAPQLVGIHTGGVWVAHALQERLHLPAPVGTLEVAFHRDDHTTTGLKAAVQPSEIPVCVDRRVLVLVDDVIHTGRTSRAALNALFDYGRPAQVLLAALIDRGGRELPIQPDIVGVRIEMPRTQRLKLLGPEPLRFACESERPT
ncbi:bifunctional pyr operon transcriptional regulator/uracil phosphoribosyltransferase [Halorhodospira abdelmalekii]|uniref:bifunctional pyr operon transcriptional regulator/uracil phosphoribosyltransferase PyrR n=1 Tax=Halorhodospira abdelmalekii TaxID=421629 RepID=UPI00190301FC|nr:bifunctional pyr operon transcriptional regulator/uracil phosphoribosyltransferase PyrR [Halorhodospira abdelmalekii]MBK1735267.1 bifunctional pyr operon transcriptional regulator/uracil phosphoribosyltransferase [Halorhodospira abdelmalekii]